MSRCAGSARRRQGVDRGELRPSSSTSPRRSGATFRRPLRRPVRTSVARPAHLPVRRPTAVAPGRCGTVRRRVPGACTGPEPVSCSAADGVPARLAAGWDDTSEPIRIGASAKRRRRVDRAVVDVDQRRRRLPGRQLDEVGHGGVDPTTTRPSGRHHREGFEPRGPSTENTGHRRWWSAMRTLGDAVGAAATAVTSRLTKSEQFP